MLGLLKTKMHGPAADIAPPAHNEDFARVLSHANLLPDIHFIELDAQGRITRLTGAPDSPWVRQPDEFVGRAPWELDCTPQTPYTDWHDARQLFDSHRPFSGLVLRLLRSQGDVSHFELAAEAVHDEAGTFVGHRGVFRDVTRRVTLERRLVIERQTAQLLAETPEPAGLVKGLLRLLCDALDWRAAAYWRMTDPPAGSAPTCADSLWRAGSAGLPPQDDVHHPFFVAPHTPDDPVHQAAQGRSPLWVADLRDLAGGNERMQRALDAGLRAAFLIPVCTPRGVLGVIELLGTHRELHDPEILEAGSHVGHHLGQALERQQLSEENLKFRTIVEALADGVYLVDRETMNFVYVNETVRQRGKYSEHEFARIGPREIMQRTGQSWESIYDRLIAHPGRTETEDIVSVNKAGQELALEVHYRALQLNGRWLIVNVSRDVTRRRRAEQAQQRLGMMYAALSASHEAIVQSRAPRELFQKICDAAVDGAGFLGAALAMPQGERHAVIAALSGVDVLGRRSLRLTPAHAEPQDLLSAAFRSRSPIIAREFSRDVRTREWQPLGGEVAVASAGSFPLRHADRTVGVLLLFSSEPQGFADEIIALLERMVENVAFALVNLAREEERRKNRERIDYLASHDALTGLANRVMFGELLSHALTTARRYERKFAVLFIDLDRFKHINDSLGHAAGDQLLQQMAQRLKDCLRVSDVIARSGGDEFVVLLQEVEEAGHVAGVARKLLSAALRPVMLQSSVDGPGAGVECRVTASVGISMFPADAQDEQALMKHADMAMYHAKAEGKNNFQFFSHTIQARAVERLTLESNLRAALDHGELKLFYQPKVDIRHGNDVVGAEALLRWDSPALGSVSPAQFIPLAEETGLIIPLGRWVLRTACEQAAEWLRAGLPAVSIAVNVSARQFADEGLVGDLAAVLRETGLPPGALELEITESVVITDTSRALRTLAEMKALGVRLAIDDFGTGYSSLGQLKRFPVDTLKVDRSFIRDLPGNSDDRAITEAIISMGKSLGLTVVAEGVETQEQLDFLRASACDEVQGFYFSKAVPADAFAQMLRARIE